LCFEGSSSPLHACVRGCVLACCSSTLACILCCVVVWSSSVLHRFHRLTAVQHTHFTLRSTVRIQLWSSPVLHICLLLATSILSTSYSTAYVARTQECHCCLCNYPLCRAADGAIALPFRHSLVATHRHEEFTRKESHHQVPDHQGLSTWCPSQVRVRASHPPLSCRWPAAMGISLTSRHIRSCASIATKSHLRHVLITDVPKG
jgi:hypothetical protein